MVLGPLSFVYNVGDVTLEIVGAVLAISLTIIGSIYSYRTFKKVRFLILFYFNYEFFGSLLRVLSRYFKYLFARNVFHYILMFLLKYLILYCYLYLSLILRHLILSSFHILSNNLISRLF